MCQGAIKTGENGVRNAHITRRRDQETETRCLARYPRHSLAVLDVWRIEIHIFGDEYLSLILL